MLWPALCDPDPVLIFEHGALYNVEGELADDARPVDISIGRACAAPGDDVTIVAYGGTLRTALGAAELLAGEGIEAEVIDLRMPRPLDTATIVSSVARTHRAVVVDEGWRSGASPPRCAARIVEEAFYDLDAPVARVCSAEVPMPYAKHLEDAALPQVRDVVAAVTAAGGVSGRVQDALARRRHGRRHRRQVAREAR